MPLCLSGLARAQATAPTQGQSLPSSITVVLDEDYPPYIFRDDHGVFQGILKDTWALWQAQTGVVVKLQPMDWRQAQAAIQAGQADVIDGLFKTPQREAIYDFSPPYADVEVPIFFHRSVSGIVNAQSLKGFTVGVKDGDACIEALAAHGVEHFQRYATYSAVLGAARSGNVRVFCMDQPPGVYLLHQLGMANDYRHSAAISTGQFHRAVRKGERALLALVERGFASIPLAQAQQIQDKWYGAQVHELGEGRLKPYLRYIVLIIVAMAAILILWNLMLQRRVRGKTQALSKTLTDLQQARLASDQAFKRLNAIADRVPGMVYQYLLRPDGSSCFPYASEAIRNIYRLSPGQVANDAAIVFVRIHPHDLPEVSASIAASARHLTPWKYEYRVRFDDGAVRWLLGDALPERQGDGSVLWHGLISDITERKQADERLQQLSQAVEQAPIAIAITDLAGNISYVNPNFTEVTGYSLDEVRWTNLRILQSGLTPSAVFVELWKTLLAGQVWRGELHNRRKNGELFIESAVISPVLNQQGVATHYVAIKKDVTRRKQSEQLLQRSLQEKTALLHEVHHRVKNNLQVVTSLLRLEAGRSDQAQTRAVLKEMQGRIYAMALLHETLYRVGNFASIDLADYLKQVATQAIRSQLGSGNPVQLQLEMVAVQVAMEQAAPCGLLVNELLGNALKHAFADGRAGLVTLQLQRHSQDRLCCVTVQDNGIGLPPDFDQRRSQSLGLQLVSDLARQLGGTLAAAPVATGGARLSVTFAPQTPKALAAL
ncbi:MAG: transporter substrate-binding domain-containing protein [Rhodoferax sp.]|nr:transporter substrate-binding domain-containing protein [Rhodoferax sp.]